MFFEESKINDILNCEKCKNRLNEPRILPCGKTICSECTSTLQIKWNKFECIICEENHFINENGLPINQLIQDLLLQTPVKVSRGMNADKLKNILEKINGSIYRIPYLLNNCEDHIKQYRMDLENEIQLAKEEVIRAAEDHHQHLSLIIAEFESECLAELKSKKMKLDEDQTKNSENLISELKLFKDEWSSYLRNTEFDDELLSEVNETGDEFIQKSENQKIILNNLIFNKTQLIFHRSNKISMNKVIGSIKKRILACILTIEQEESLFKLCNLNPDDDWSLIYQATRDGFSASDFHSKCDTKQNLLIVIKSKNGNIFGGYTQHNWSGIDCYKNDPDAFIFSLINTNNKPILIKTSKPENAIYCKASYGPAFGGGHDLFICSDSNTINSSFSNLCSSYLHPYYAKNSSGAKSFLAGSNRFSTYEILVFSKNSFCY